MTFGMTNVVGELGIKITGYTSDLSSSLKTTIRIIIGIVTGGLSEIVLFTIENWDTIKKVTVETWESVKKKTDSIWKSITDFFIQTWRSIKKTFNAGLDAVSKSWENTWNGIKEFTSNTWTAIKEMVSGGIETVADLFFGGVSIIGNAWRSIWDNVVNILDGIFGKVRSMVDSVISWVQKAIDRINIFKSKQSSVGGGYSQGGFTFGGVQDIAGVVHGGEWVAPAWMVDKYAGVISQLESVRTRGFRDGGMVGSNTTHNNQRTVHQSITQNIREGVDFSIAAREMAWRARFT